MDAEDLAVTGEVAVVIEGVAVVTGADVVVDVEAAKVDSPEREIGDVKAAETTTSPGERNATDAKLAVPKVLAAVLAVTVADEADSAVDVAATEGDEAVAVTAEDEAVAVPCAEDEAVDAAGQLLIKSSFILESCFGLLKILLPIKLQLSRSVPLLLISLFKE